MKRLLFLTLAGLFALPAVAQIEMDNSGVVGMGGATLYSDPLLRQELAVSVSGTHALNVAISAYASGGSTYSQGLAVSASGSTGTDAYGIQAGAGSGDYNYGIYTYASASAGQTAYGIYAKTFSGAGTRYAGYFDGDVTVTGTFSNPSDLRFKEDVLDLRENGVLDRVLRLRPVGYQYMTGEYESMSLPEGDQFGLVAQEVEVVFPELVSEQIHPAARNESGEVTTEAIEYKALNYIQLIPILVQAIQDQQEEIEELRGRINQLSN